MPLGSVEAENLAFQCMYGDTKAAIAPASVTVHLLEGYLTDDVTLEASWVELAADGGYTPATLANTSANFPAPGNGEQTVVTVTFTSTGPFNATAYYAGLKDPAGNLLEYVELDEPLDVAEAGTVTLDLAFWHNDSPESDVDEDF